MTGTLRLGVFDQSSTNPNARAHDAICRFDVVAPDVALEISLAPPSNLEARVIDGTLDLAIVPMYKKSTQLNYLPIYDEHMTLYCGKGHDLFGVARDLPLSKLGLERFKYAGYAFNSPNMKAGQGLGIKRAARVQEEEALVLLIQSGRYIGYLADHVAATFLQRGAVWPIAPNDTAYRSTFAAISRRKPKPNRKTLELIECLKSSHEQRENE